MSDMWIRWNDNDEAAAGLVLVAADVQQGLMCGETDFSTTNLPMAQVLATNDGVLNMTRTAMNIVLNSNATQIIEIFGANHASFGDYDDSERGVLFGQVDGEALIPDSVVWDMTAAAIASVASRTGTPLPNPTAETENDGHNMGASNETIEVECPPSDMQPTTSGEAGVSSILKIATLLSVVVSVAVTLK